MREHVPSAGEVPEPQRMRDRPTWLISRAYARATGLLQEGFAADGDGRLELLGDAPDESTDSRTFGSIDPSTVRGRPWFRYWPVGRIGRIG